MEKLFEIKDLLNDKQFGKLKEYISPVLESFTRSTFYKVSTDEELVDETIRKSTSIKLYNIDFISYLKDYFLKQFGPEVTVNLARDHATFHNYIEGDFFDYHIDHEMYTLNQRQLWMEGHFVYCLTAPEQGGDLEIEYGKNIYPYTENSGILFDKKIRHKAMKVIKGTKLVMTIDVMFKHNIPPLHVDYDKCVSNASYDVVSMGMFLNTHLDLTPFGVFVYNNDENDFNLVVIYDSTGMIASRICRSGSRWGITRGWVAGERDGIEYNFNYDVLLKKETGGTTNFVGCVEMFVGEECKCDDSLEGLNIVGFDSTNKINNINKKKFMEIYEFAIKQTETQTEPSHEVIESVCNEPPEGYTKCEFKHICGYIVPKRVRAVPR